MKKLYYLASPYSHKDKSVMKQRANDVTLAAVELYKQHIFTFAPISYNEPWESYDLPGNFEYWEEFDKLMIDKCDAVIVLTIDGWDKSVGVAEEIKYAERTGKKVFYSSLENILNGTFKNFIG